MASQIEEVLRDISNTIEVCFQEKNPHDSILQCGSATSSILHQRPNEILQFAYQKLSTWPYAVVPTCWRRLYEDASLAKAVQHIRSSLEVRSGAGNVKRRRLNTSETASANDPDTFSMITELVNILDNGLNISGAPARAELFAAIFSELSSCIDKVDNTMGISHAVNIQEFIRFESDNQITIAANAPSIDQFQAHLDTVAIPLVIKHTFEHWPALSRWQHPAYFLHLTVGGRRQVPVELGRSYTDEAWGQRFMSFREFLDSYILSDTPVELGYLAQHDLFAQIPQLRNDITIPDYCWTVPPASEVATTQVQLDEPLLNAWFGPKGTKTPLHTDPYHNILCQVVGYKYLRLYSPSEAANVYPSSTDENGVNMQNTSQIDVEHFSYASRAMKDSNSNKDLDKQFPNFHQATFQEAVLGPGDSLYIPLGWWHYAESLSISFSVSFWWD